MKILRFIFASLAFFFAFAFKPGTASASGIEFSYSAFFTSPGIHIIASYDHYVRIGNSNQYVNSGSAGYDLTNGQTVDVVTGTTGIDSYSLSGLGITTSLGSVSLSPAQIATLKAGSPVTVTIISKSYTITPIIGDTSIFSIQG